MKIYCLMENTASGVDFLSEHGLSLFIDTGKHKILFDMGQSDGFSENAKKLGLDLGTVDIAILSHGHYDHGGGLKKFLEINDQASVYMSSHAFEPHYNGTSKYIGLDVALKDSGRIIFIENTVNIDTGITLFSCNDRKKEFDLGSFGLTAFRNGEHIPDDFYHEQYLLIEENGKRILFSGCSHRGILNIASWFKADIIIGGFHFSKLPLDNTLDSYAKYLDSFNTKYYTCHCTGAEQYEHMKKHMKRLHYISSGEKIVI